MKVPGQFFQKVSILDLLRNPKDPIHTATPNTGKELFRRFGQLANGFPNEAVIDAAYAIIMNIIRVNSPTWGKAEAVHDDLFGRAKTLLRENYDANGKRRSVFPFDQHIIMPFHVDKDKGN